MTPKYAKAEGWRDGDTIRLEETRMRLHGIDAPDRRRGHLRYGRTVARCLLGELDIEAEMVRRGLAWAFVKYSRDYVAQEAEALRHTVRQRPTPHRAAPRNML